MPTEPLTAIRPQRILLIKPSALGDIIHALPVLTALRRRFTSAHIAWAVNRVYEPLLKGHPDLDATLPFDRGALRGGWLRASRTWLDYFRLLQREQFDLVIDLQGLLRSGLMTRATGAPRRVGLAGAREGARWFYTDTLPDPGRGGLHAVERYWRVVEALGAADDAPKTFRLQLDPEAQRWASNLLESLPRPWLVVGAGSRWETKRWPPEQFAEVANRARAEVGGSVILVGTVDESPLNEAVRVRLDGPSLDLTGRTTLPQLAAILARADAMLANDTGPLHLAVALGRPVVAPYTCTKAALTGPYGQADHVVETRVWCAGSYQRTCSRLECMTELSADRLWPVVRKVFTAWHTHRESA
ncbi:MAG: glycosyltransferase family 9 protein [Gemmataceae bacterium]